MKNQALGKYTARTIYLSPADCALRLNVATVTLRKWARQGLLQAVVTPGGHRRYAVDEVARFAAEHKLPFHLDTNSALRILIIDDDVQLCRYLAELLGRQGQEINTEQVHNGFEAGHRLHTFKPDIVLLDLMMPGIDGYQVCAAIKSDVETRHIRVIAMTGFYSQDNIDRIIQAGAETCLAKPIDRNGLLEKIDLHRYAVAMSGTGKVHND